VEKKIYKQKQTGICVMWDTNSILRMDKVEILANFNGVR